MRRAERAMEPEEAKRFLETASVGRLGMISEGEPYVVPLNYVYLDDAVYFHSAPEGRKMEALRGGARVCFEVDVLLGIKDDIDPCAMGAYFKSATIFGECDRVEDPEEALRVLEALVDKHSRRPDRSKIPRESLDSVVVMKVVPEHLSGKMLEAPSGFREPV